MKMIKRKKLKRKEVHIFVPFVPTYVATVYKMWTKVYKVRVHLAQIPVIKAKEKKYTTDVKQILGHMRFSIKIQARAHMKRHSMQ